MSELTLPFRLRDRSGTVEVRTEPNRDPEELGHPLVAVGYDREAFRGFPVVEGRVRYDGSGPRAWMGWLQVVVRHDDDGSTYRDVDALPVFGEESPLYAFGHAPTFSDFPANPDHPDGSWNAYTFLVAVPDVVRSRALDPVAAFHWGYRLRGGRPVELFEPSPVPLEMWNQTRELLAGCYPTWEFRPVTRADGEVP